MSGPHPPQTEDELREMSTEQAMIAGADADGVHVVHRRDQFPVPGTKAEKRAERTVSAMFVLSALAGVAFIVVFVAVPYEYKTPGHGQNFRFYTPLLGGLLGLMLALLGIGAIMWAKLLMTEEELVQERHDEPEAGAEQVMTAATLMSGINDTGLPRRSMLVRSLGLAGGAVATVPLVVLVGGLLKKPGKQLDQTLFKPDPVRHPNGIPIVYSDGRRVSPNDGRPPGQPERHPGGRPGHRVPGSTRRDQVGQLPHADHQAASRAGQTRQGPQGPGQLGMAGLRRVLEDLHTRRLPGVAVRTADHPAAVPVPPVAVRGARGREAGFRASYAKPA